MKEHFTCLVRNYMGGKPEQFLNSSFFRDKDAAISYAERSPGIVRIVSNIQGVIWERKDLDS